MAWMARWITSVMLAVLLAVGGMTPARAAAGTADDPAVILQDWYRLILQLVRHTATYSPPVASRSFAYIGVTAFEAQVGGPNDLHSLAGQVAGLTAPPARDPAATYDEAVVLNAAMAEAVRNFFGNTGPTGQRALQKMTEKHAALVAEGVDPEVLARSEAQGVAVADHILAWSKGDGGAVIENMGFPYEYKLTPGPAHWVPTSTIAVQQVPLLPGWGNNRTFGMANGAACDLPPPLPYSEEPGSAFYEQGNEVYETVRNATPEQKTIARFWSDDPMLSPTPPGHWVSIALEVMEQQGGADAPRIAEVQALLGMTLADAFVGCWNKKFEYDLVRPVTYIKRVIDPNWEPLLITPPFPEYPSGHSTQSGAAATILTALFGEVAFEDHTHVEDGIPARSFPNFWAAAQEAAVSRLYGGIHFRAANENGLEQGRCIGQHLTGLKTRG